MARKKGQTYTAEKKAKIVLELLKEERTINQIASELKSLDLINNQIQA